MAIKQVIVPLDLDRQVVPSLRSNAIREAQTAARITHPNAVRVYDIVQAQDLPWIVMEYVSSVSLRDVIKSRGPLSPGYVATVGLALLDALSAAHSVGVLHRDVTPQNVLLGDDGRVVLADFGLAAWMSGAGCADADAMGTAEFVAPERARDGVSSVESDLWSLGATLYAATEGRSPYARPTVTEMLTALLTQEADPCRFAGGLEPVLRGLLHRDPEQRIRPAQVRAGLRLAAQAG